MRAILSFLFLSTLFSVNAQSAEPARWLNRNDGSIAFWVMHSELGRTFVEHFELPKGRMQRRTKSTSFSSPAKARAYFERVAAGYGAGRPRFPGKPRTTEVPGESIWPTTSSWNLDWEEKFADWVRTTADSGFLARYNVPTDCADAAITLRWIFARINGLPVGDQLVVTGVLFTNESMLQEWAALPSSPNWYEDKRFLAALDYIEISTFTHTLMGDLYPTEITPLGLRPGTVLLHLYNGQTGHTEIVHLTGADQPNAITMMASDEPRAVRVLNEYGIQDWGYQPVAGRDGFLHFRWPEKQEDGTWHLVDAEKMPLYSLQQYDPHFVEGYKNFTEAVIHHAVPDFSLNPRLALRARTAELIDRLTLRRKIVEDGFAFCSQNNCAQGTPGWEAWSTPSRDAAIGRLNTLIWGLYQQANCDGNCKYELDSRRSQRLMVIQDKPYTLQNALEVWWTKTFNSDPNHPIQVRWGK